MNTLAPAGEVNGVGNSRWGNSMNALMDVTSSIEDPRRIIRQGLAVIILFFGVFGVWSILGSISGAVIAQGTIKVESERKTIQHLEGGLVESILVNDGDEVTRGQSLIVLQSTQVDASVDLLTKNLLTFLAKRARFLAEKDLAEDIHWGVELEELVSRYQAQEILEGEERLFEVRRESYKSQMDLIQAQISQIGAQIDGLQEQSLAETTIIATLDEELTAKRQLVAERYLERSQVLELERQLAAHKGSRGNLKQAMAEARRKIAELRLRMGDVTVRFVEEAASRKADLDSQIAQVREQLRPSFDAQTRLQVVAPVAGRIVGLRVHSPGGVVGAGEPLMDIVPLDSPMIVETRIPVDKITEVYVGQKVKVQLDAFDRRTTPLIDGHVASLGADRQEEQTSLGNIPYYKCLVELSAQAIHNENLYLSPGMPATAFITTSKRTILGYMLEPLLKSWDRALRD